MKSVAIVGLVLVVLVAAVAMPLTMLGRGFAVKRLIFSAAMASAWALMTGVQVALDHALLAGGFGVVAGVWSVMAIGRVRDHRQARHIEVSS